MLTEALIASFVKAQATAMLPAGTASQILAGTLGDGAKAATASLLARFNADERFQRAIESDRTEVLEMLRDVAIATARVVAGQNLDGNAALALLHELACDPATRRRFRVLLNEAATNTDDRIAMLAAGYFVGGQRVSARARLDWALRGLFPEDADTLGALIDLCGATVRISRIVITCSAS